MLAFFFRLARFLFLVVVVRYLIQWLFSAVRSATSRSQSFPEPPASEISNPPVVVEARRDPVCGTFVSTELAVKALVGGKEQHFCSKECRDKWIADGRLEIADRNDLKPSIRNPQ